MATEKRLIDANALKETVITDYYEHFTRYHDTDQIALIDMVCDDIDETSTVDAAEVVRCKDCKHCCLDLSGRENHLCMRKEVGFVVRRKANDFCSYGERKDNG